MCCRISPGTISHGCAPLVGAVVEAAPLLAADDDAGCMSKVALLLAPPKPDKPKKPDE